MRYAASPARLASHALTISVVLSPCSYSFARAQADTARLRLEALVENPVSDPSRIISAYIAPDRSLYLLAQSTPFLLRHEAQRWQPVLAESIVAELRAPMRFGWYGDSLWLIDLARELLVTQEALNHSSVRALAWPQALYGGAMPAAQPLSWMADGSLLVLGQPREVPQGELRVAPVFRVPRTGTDHHVLIHLEVDPEPVPEAGTIPVVLRPQPWSHSDILGASPTGDRFVVVHWQRQVEPGRTTYELRSFTPTGSVLFSRSLPYVATPISPDAVNERISETAQRMAASLGRPEEEVRLAVRRALFVPAFEPPVRRVSVASDGSTWIERYSVRDGTAWDVWDRQGTSSFVHSEQRVRVLDVAGERVWGVVVADKEARLGIFRIER